MTKLVKFMVARAALPAKVALQAKAATKSDGSGFQALLRKLTSPAAADKTETGAPSVHPGAEQMGERGDFEIGSSLRPVLRDEREAGRSLPDRLLAASPLTEGEDALPGGFPEEAQPDEPDAEVGQGGAPAIPDALSAFLLSPEKAVAAPVEPGRRDAMPDVAAGPLPASRDARLIPAGDPAVPAAGPADIAGPSDFDVIAAPIAMPARRAFVDAVDAVPQIVTEVPTVVAPPVAAAVTRSSAEAAADVRPEMAPVIATVLSRETHFVPARGRDVPAAMRGLHDPDRTEASGPRPAFLAAPDVAEPNAKVEPDADNAPPEGTARGDEPVQDVAVAAAGPDPLPTGQPATGLPPAVLQQIGAAVVTGADSLAGRASDRSLAPAEMAAPVPTPGRLDSMEVRLDLPEHGALHVRVTLAGAALSLRFRADRDETAHRMHQDRDELSAILTRAGYSADILAIQVRPADGPAPSPSMPSGGQQAPTGDGATTHGQREQRQSQHQQPPPGGSRQNPGEHAPHRDRPSGGLYV